MEKIDKREFLKRAGALATGCVAESVLARGEGVRQSLLARGSHGEGFAQSGEAAGGHRTNWAGNLTFSTDNLQLPGTLGAVQQTVKSTEKLRALGSRHSFNAIADSRYEQVSLARMVDIALDERAKTVTVGGGVTYALLAPWLDARGWALHNLASLPGITVAGSCATATHGSGMHNGNLAKAVVGLELVKANGEVLHLTRAKDGDNFLGAVVGLGAVGVVTHTTLAVQPAYQVAQTVYENLSFDELGRNFEAIYASGYSVSVFTDWQNHRATQLWVKKRLGAGYAGATIDWPETMYGATKAREKLHPLAGHDAESCTDQQGIPGPWYDRLPHFRIGQTPSSGQESQSEYLVPFEDGFKAVQAVEKLYERIGPHLFVTELRVIAADDLWMSTARGRLSLAVHFTWKPEWEAVQALLPAIEEQLRPFAPRPHWGKLFTMAPAELAQRYARLKEFKALLAEFDPSGKFRNEFVNANLYAG
jgi:alditol oxidase